LGGAYSLPKTRVWFILLIWAKELSSMLDSPATWPVNTRVLTGRVARLSSKSNFLWT
jgi:hypothetical protein